MNLLELEAPAERLTIEELAARVEAAAAYLHRELGSGLLENVYEAALTKLLRDEGLAVARQASVPISFAGITIDEGFRADLIVEQRLVIEVKSTDGLAPINRKQLLTFLRLMHLRLGLLINFGAETFAESVVRVGIGNLAHTKARRHESS